MTAEESKAERMTTELRDKIAIAAMKRLISDGYVASESNIKWLAKRAYEIADAMLEEREKERMELAKNVE